MKNKSKLAVVGLLSLMLFACSKEKDEVVENVIKHDTYKDGEAERIYAATFSADFKTTVDNFEKKFGTHVNRTELLKGCSGYSFYKFSEKDTESFRKQIESFTDYMDHPTFVGKNVKFNCYKGKNYYGYGDSGIEFFNPTPIKSLKSTEDNDESILLYSENVAPAEFFVDRYVKDQKTESKLIESKNKLRGMSVGNFNHYLSGNLMGSHEALVKAIDDGNVNFNESLLGKIIQDNFSSDFKLVNVDWDNADGGIFSPRSNYIRVLFGNDSVIFDYKITLSKHNFNIDTYIGNSERDRLVSLLLKKNDLSDQQKEEVNDRFLLSTGFYLDSRGTSIITKYTRNGNGQIAGSTESECDGDFSLFQSSGAPIFNLKDHSVCNEKVKNLGEQFKVIPFSPTQLLDEENLTFDQDLSANSQVIVAQIGAGVEYNNLKVNWRLLTQQNSLVSFNQIFPYELPFESSFFNSPFSWEGNFAFGSALTALSSFGSARIKVVPVKIDPFNPDFGKIFDFLESKNVQLALISPSVFKYFDVKKGLESLSSAIEKHKSIFVVVDAGSQSKNLNQSSQNIGCVNSDRSIVVTASLVNELAVSSSSNFGNKCVEVALAGSQFIVNRSFSQRVNDKFNTTNPEKLATGFAAAKLTNYLAKSILLKKTNVSTAKSFLIEKTVSVPSMLPYLKGGKVFPASVLQTVK